MVKGVPSTLEAMGLIPSNKSNGPIKDHIHPSCILNPVLVPPRLC